MTAETPQFVMWTPDPMDGRYERAGDSDEVLRLSKPFAIELPIREITP
jgi:hypothetical protein